MLVFSLQSILEIQLTEFPRVSKRLLLIFTDYHCSKVQQLTIYYHCSFLVAPTRRFVTQSSAKIRIQVFIYLYLFICFLFYFIYFLFFQTNIRILHLFYFVFSSQSCITQMYVTSLTKRCIKCFPFWFKTSE